MITKQLIEECIHYDESEYQEHKTYDQMKKELEELQTKGCHVEHIMHCSGCPLWKNGYPIK